jgi:hypothetical protein
MSKSSLDNFISKVRQEGLLLGSHFYIILPPPFTGEWENQNLKDIMMLCESINVPSHTIATSDVRVFGENREHAYMPLYGSIQATFLLDRNTRVKKFFEQWMNMVVDREKRTVGYYNNFTTYMYIFITDRDENVVNAVLCKDVFPKVISEIRLDYSSKDVLRLSVDFSVKSWETVSVNESGDISEAYAIRFNALRSRGDFALSQRLAEEGVVVVPNEPLGTSLGFKTSGSYGLTGNFVKDIGSIGKSFGTDALRGSNATYALIQSSPGSTTNSFNFANAVKSVGDAAGKLGAAVSGIGEGIRAVTAPASAVANATVGLSNALGSLNAVTSVLGMGSPFSSAQASLTNVAGKMAVVSNAGGIVNPLGSLGSSLGAVGGAFESITKSVGSIPGGTQKIADSVKSLGSVFNRSGANIQQSSSTLGDGVSEGKYT